MSRRGEGREVTNREECCHNNNRRKAEVKASQKWAKMSHTHSTERHMEEHIRRFIPLQVLTAGMVRKGGEKAPHTRTHT